MDGNPKNTGISTTYQLPGFVQSFCWDPGRLRRATFGPTAEPRQGEHSLVMLALGKSIG